jgi:hypothetical protein
MTHAMLLVLVPVCFGMALGYGALRLRILDNRSRLPARRCDSGRHGYG